MERVAFRAKQLLGLQPADKIVTAVELRELQESCQALSDPSSVASDGWTIRAFFKSPRRLPAVPTIQQARRPRLLHRQRVPEAVSPGEAEQGGFQVAAPAGLQHAVSTMPMESQRGPAAVTLDAMLGAADLQNMPMPAVNPRSLSWALPALNLLPSAMTQCPARQQSQCDATAAKLSAVAADLAALQQYTDQQAALLAECRACAAVMRRQAQQAQVHLALCHDQIAAMEQQEQDLRAAAKQDSRQAADQIELLQAEMRELAASTTAERQHLQQATVAAQRSAEGLEAMAWERLHGAAGLKRRCELMEASHLPLTEAEKRKQQQAIEKYRTRCS